MADKVKPLKLEDSTSGGTETDLFPTEANPSEDYLACKGVALENSDNYLIDKDGNGNIQFKDAVFTVPVSVDSLKEIDPSRKIILFDDWLANVSTGQLGWSNSTNGANSTVIISEEADQNHPGIVSVVKGTTAGGRASLFLGDRSFRLGGGEVTIEMLVRIPVLSTAAQEYDFFIGLGDDASASEHGDGVYFVYDRNTSVNWICRTASNFTRSSSITSTAVPADTWQKLKIVINAAGTSAQFFIGGASVAVITTDIPTATGRVCAPFIKIQGSAGTTARQADIDYYYLHQIFTTSR